MEKHTPGPWRSKDEDEANARLIAAAPDLLAACELFERASGHRSTAADEGGMSEEESLALSRAYHAVQAAIAKARGGE